MPSITITLRGKGLDQFTSGVAKLGMKARTEMERGLATGGNKLRTDVRRALKSQTGVVKYGVVVQGVRGYLNKGGLSYVISSSDGGLPIRDFKVQVSRSKATSLRWSRKEHWRLQKRDASGRFGVLPPDTGAGGVSAHVWNAPRTFKRSFADERGELYAALPGRRSRRKLFGPSLPKELPKDQSIAAWQGGTDKVVDEIVKRLLKLMP